jgi:hypothetical protein
MIFQGFLNKVSAQETSQKLFPIRRDFQMNRAAWVAGEYDWLA